MTQSRWHGADERSPQNSSNYRDLLSEATVQIRQLRHQIDNLNQRQSEPIAIVGMACRFPGGANTPEAYWQLLRDGVDAVGEIPSQRWNIDNYYNSDPAVPGKMYTRYGSFVDQIDQFDAQFFGISPREAHSLDPQQRLLLEVSYTALENAGAAPFDLQGSATGVFVGLSFDDYAQRSIRSGDLSRIDAFSSLGNTRSIAAGRIAYVFGFQGPTMQLDTTCSSSLLAVHLACQSLRNGESNLALAGGVNLMLSPEATVGFCKLKALSADGRCKTFDASADGYGRGEGCGMVVLKRLSDAVANQDNILALVKGSAVNHDGISNGLTAPNGSAQTAVIRQAIANAKVDPHQIQYVEAHGTGTALGDPIELLSLNQALGERTTPLLVGCVKTNFGHLEAAAGIAGLMKVILSLQHRQIPPHLHLTTPNPHIPWGRLAIEVPLQLTPWPQTEAPKLAGLSGFGMSGTNVHLVIEEAVCEEIPALIAPEALSATGLSATGLSVSDLVESELSVVDRSQHLLALSARSAAALRELIQRYQDWLPQTNATLADICFSANTGRSHFDHRLALVATDKADLARQLAQALATPLRSPQLPVSHRRKVAFLFTGQGAQYLGMARQLYESEPIFRDALNDCAQYLASDNIPLLELLYPTVDADSNSLDQTAFTQPVLFSIAYALTQLWAAWGIQPDYVLGHSIGEYAAAHAAGVFSLADGLRLIAARGRLMQALPSGGGMVAVMADKAQVESLLDADLRLGRVEISAVNGPENTVIAGDLTVLEAAIAQLATQGVRAKMLRVSHAFHSARMEPMLNEFARVARSVQYSSPNVEFVSSVTGRLVGAELTQPDYWASYWVNQIRQSVQFATAMETLAAEGCDRFIEIGPKPTLIAMGQACLPSLSDEQAAEWLPSLSPLKARDAVQGISQTDTESAVVYPDWQVILASLGKVYEGGGAVDWAGFDKSYPRQLVLLPNYPFQRQTYWLAAEERSSIAQRLASTGQGHPLLGQSLSLAGDYLRCFESQLSPDEPLAWSDHRVFGAVLMPAVAYLEMGLAAGKEIFAGHYSLENISLQRALWLDSAMPMRLQTLVTQQATQQATDSHQFEIYSLSANASETNWTRHVVGNLTALATPSVAGGEFEREALDIERIRQRLTNTLSAQEFYLQCAQRGIDYGPSFQAIREISFGSAQDEALAHVGLPIVGEAVFWMHPVLLDAGLQLAGMTLSAEQTSSYLPVAIERFSFTQPIPAGEIWISAQRRLKTSPDNSQLVGEQTVVDIFWLSDQGRVFAELEGLKLLAVEAEQVLASRPLDTFPGNPLGNSSDDESQARSLGQSQEPSQWLHQVEWRSHPLPQPPHEFLRSPKAIAHRIAPHFSELIQQPDFISYQALQPQLNRLAQAYIHQAFLQMGWSVELRDAFKRSAVSANELADELGIAPQHRRLFKRCLVLLNSSADERESQSLDPQQIYQRCQQLSQHSLLKAELALLSRCGEGLASVLQGQLDPLTLLFPSGNLTDLAQLYQSSVGLQVMNQLVQAAVSATVAQPPQARPLRILEIGAGTGGTTAYLLSQLATLPCEITYLFTDISPRFISAAKERFQQFSFVDYALLDIESSSQSQAVGRDFDLVIAANVLHATADVQQTLENVRDLLAPGGELILLEGSQPVGWVDLIFGLTPGWWKFTDTALRGDYPLLSAAQWQTLLKSVGFETADTLKPEDNKQEDNAFGELTQSVMIAQRKKAVAQPWSLVGEAADTLQIAPLLTAAAQSFDFAAQVESARRRKVAYKGVIYALPAIAPEPAIKPVTEADAVNTEMAETAEAIVCRAIKTIQFWAGQPQSPRLYFVSINSVHENSSPTVPLVHSALLGLLKTSQLEHPELRCTYIQAETAEQLMAELLADSLETQVIYHRNQRRVARLEAYQPEAPRLEVPQPEETPTQLVISSPGSLSALHWQPTPRGSLSAYEVEICIHATGLNFRDVLVAMGQYPEVALLGCECTGEIVAIGSAVTDLRVGQSVMAIATGSFAQYVTVHRDLVALIPTSLTPTTAATLLVAFITAYYSLCQLAQLKASDRVLIHAATGGVGQAAIQIAQQIGAEIFATASPSKWDTLRSLGITHIMNSRTLTFADDIMAITHGEGVSVVLNALPGKFRANSLKALGHKGRFVEIGKGEGLTVEQIARVRPDIYHFVVDLSALCQQHPQRVQTMLRHLQREVNAGNWRSLPYTTFPQSNAVQAFRRLQQAKHTGKIVVTQNDTSAANPVGQPADQAIDQAIHLRPDATYLITGGLGGLGIVTAQWMADHGAQRIVLLARQAPTAAALARIQQIAAQGVTVDVMATDVTDLAAMTAALDQIKLPQQPLRGVIHAAGVLADGLIQQLTEAQIKQVLAPKVTGAWLLHSLTQHCELDFFVLFSSAAALLGSPGQANHAAANAFLDGLAHYRHQQGLPALSLNWGAWSTVGAALKYQQKGRLEQFSGVEVIAPQQGLAQLERLWSTTAAQVGIVPITWPAFLTQPALANWPFLQAQAALVERDRPLESTAQSTAQSAFLTDLAQAPFEQKRQILETYVCQQLCQVLGFSPSEFDSALARQTGFFDLGMDSLTALEFKNSLQTDLKLPLPSTLAFDYPTVEALLGYLCGQLIGDDVAAASPVLGLAERQPSQASLAVETQSTDFTFAAEAEDDLIAQMDRKLADIEDFLREDTA
jgi:acyl transferase domain-containing protein/NADPH:quinone reductase-like Zn-dependent oxidoreductase/SAM-dependent methyltransferase